MRILSVVLALSLVSGPVFCDQAELDQALHEAVNFHDLAAISASLEKGADPNSVNRLGYTPLMRAAELRQPDIVRLLLNGGADPNLRDSNGRPIVELAVEAGSAETVEALLNGGADFNVADGYGDPMVLRTVRHGGEAMYDILTLLGRHDVNMDLGVPSHTPLYYAADQANARLVKALLAAGADPSLATEDGRLPLAAALSSPDILGILLKAGADPNGVDRDGDPVLFRALFSAPAEAAEALIAAGADVNRPGADGRTPLLRAQDGGAEDIMALLKSHGAADGKESKAAREPAKRAATTEAAPADNEYPAMAELPVYPGAETMYIADESHAANFLSSDPLAKVGKVTEKLLQEAGWEDANHPHARREDDHRYVMFVRGRFLLITDISIARAMGNQTAITYSIMARNSDFGRLQ